MNLSQIKNKLSGLQPKPKQKFEKVDYKMIYWKPTVGKHQIRIVPSKFDKENPFREIYFHYGFAKFPILALSNWGEQDPIIDFSKSLRKSKEKEDWQLAKKIDPKMRIFVPVIVRGEEEKGVRLWEFGKEIYQQLLGIAADEDYGDYTNIMDGRDFTIEGTEGEAMGKKIIKCAIRIKPKTTPLSINSTDVEKWLNEQPDILTLYKKNSFDELKDILQKWLNPEEEVEDTVSATIVDEENKIPNDLPWDESEESPAPKKTTTYKPEAKATKKSSVNKFDALFEQ
jgi:hypothetical protein